MTSAGGRSIGDPPTYGERSRFGPYRWQAVRFVGRALERLGAWLDQRSWGW